MSIECVLVPTVDTRIDDATIGFLINQLSHGLNCRSILLFLVSMIIARLKELNEMHTIRLLGLDNSGK